jgi:hypothetical protein
MPYIKKGSQTEIGKMVEELAGKVPAPLSWLMPDPYDPTSLIQPIGGIAKKQAIKKVVEVMKDPALSPILREGLRSNFRDLIQVIKATPKKALTDVKEFILYPGKRTVGSYSPERLAVWPHEKSLQGDIFGKVGDALADMVGGMEHTFAHEAGHSGTMRIAEKVRRKQGRLGSMIAYLTNPSPFEGAAEYAGSAIRKKAGLSDMPFFGHGRGQKEIFEKISAMPSKNPWMNVYRYFQEIYK